MASLGRPGVPVDEVAVEVLVAHQRMDSRSCLCGWDKWGEMHARHQVAMLREAGVLRDAGDQLPLSPPGRGRAL